MTQDLTTEALRKDFLAVFWSKKQTKLSFHQVVVNLIGEHTDYNWWTCFPSSYFLGNLWGGSQT